jgi:hypothetical protein
MAAKKKTPEGEKCERTLPFKLNDEDKARHGETAADLNKRLEDAKAAKKAEAAVHNENIKGLGAKLSHFLKMISEGIEQKVVTATEVKNFELNRVEFWFEGEILETREMTTADRQLDLKGTKTKKGFQKTGKVEEPKEEEFVSPDRQADMTAEKKKKLEVAEIIRSESNKRTKRSAADGARA